MELEVDVSIVVESVDHHEIKVLFCVALLFLYVVVPLDAVHYERHQDLQTGILLHYSQNCSFESTFYKFLEVRFRA